MATTTTKSAAAVGLLALIASISVLLNNLSKPELTKVQWDQVDESLEAVNSRIYKVYVDDNPIGQNILGVTCVSTSESMKFTCTVPLKNLNLTPALHSISFTVSDALGESGKSVPVEVNYLVVSEPK